MHAAAEFKDLPCRGWQMTENISWACAIKPRRMLVFGTDRSWCMPEFAQPMEVFAKETGRKPRVNG